MNVTQLTLCYLPITGGQEVYVDQLSRVIGKKGVSQIIQALPRGAYDLECSEGQAITMIKMPRGLGRLNNLLPLVLFRELAKKKLRMLPPSDKLVVHYASILPNLDHPPENTVVVSHGRDWDGSVCGRYRSYKLINAYRRGIRIVCNDLDVSNFIARTVGLDYTFTNANRRCGALYYLPNFYDDSLFFYDEESVINRKYFVMVRNIRKSRGIDLAITAYSRYVKNGGKRGLKIVGGPTNGPYFKYIVELANSLSVYQNIEFVGQKGRHEISDIYRNAALSIVPSIAFEGTSISALESMAVGCPCASTTVGGLLELPTIKFSDLDGLVKIMENCDSYNRLIVAESVSQYSSSKWSSEWSSILE